MANTKKGLSAGRCQTPALRLIYDNQTQIDNNEIEFVYNTKGYFTSKNIEFIIKATYSKI